MHGLQDKIVVSIRCEQAHELPSITFPGAVFYEALRVRTPLAEVVIHINDGNPCFMRLPLQIPDGRGYRGGAIHKTFPILKVKRIDDVDDQDNRLAGFKGFGVMGVLAFFRFHESFLPAWMFLLYKTADPLPYLNPRHSLYTERILLDTRYAREIDHVIRAAPFLPHVRTLPARRTSSRTSFEPKYFIAFMVSTLSGF
jgi:hypothetical protein